MKGIFNAILTIILLAFAYGIIVSAISINKQKENRDKLIEEMKGDQQ